ncbi:MAG: flagellar basal body rod protein FlgC [Verrucomicrobiales bacterium]|nr:flagellar basal body rod protein FlgC [Verrucomicrobiales bacterium]MBR91098.1 flagellar basal body rod protein FlgC [Verrucomicrobiales bacterium]
MPGVESAASALQAEKTRMEVIGQNIANANTTRTEKGGPYQRQVVQFQTYLEGKLGVDPSDAGQKVRISEIMSDPRPPREIYQPGHPDADDNGIVKYPNVRVHEEMADLIASSRAMEANLAIIRTARSMALQTLNIGRA